MTGSIFFQARADKDGVNCLIYSHDGKLLACHWMSLEGATTRLHDFEAAIAEAKWDREMVEVQAIVGQRL